MFGVEGRYNLSFKFMGLWKKQDTIRSHSEAIMSTDFLYFELDSVIEQILDLLLGEGSSLFHEWDERSKGIFCVTGRLDCGRNTYLSNTHVSLHFPASLTIRLKL